MSVDTTTFDAAAAADVDLVIETETATETDGADENAAETTAETTAADAVAETGTVTEAAAETVLDTGTEVTFASLDLPAPLLGVLAEAGVATAFPIQAATIPDALIGRDVLGRGRTGSGKTLAFGLPTLTRLEGLRAKPRRPLGLVLVPTRELAMQVEDALRPYARSLRLRIRSVYGGAPMRKQIDGLRYGVELLVATPGRLSDLIERGECELDEVDVAILDEADQMCDMGFLPHVCELMDQVAPGGQRLLFSATLDGAVDEIVKKYMNDPVLHEVDPQAGVVSTMSHHILMVAPQHKAKVAAQIAGRHSGAEAASDGRSIFFVRTQMAVDRVTEQLRERGLPAAGLHGGMTQVARTKTLEDFKDGRTPVLIATDVAARGIHVDGIDLVVHIDPPRDSKDYLHRAGRTARAGQAGVVASLVLPKQRRQAQRLMDEAGVTAEELDAAPLGVGGKWESAGAKLAELTGAREVPEPGDVTPFTVPVRERDRDRDRPGGRREFDRRDGGRRDGGSFGRLGDRDNRRPFESRGGFDRNRPEGRSFERRGYEGRDNRGFDRSRDGERFNRDDSRPRSFENRNAGGRSFENRGGFDRNRPEGRSFENRGSEGRTPDNRGAENRGAENRTPENRTFDNRGSANRGGFEKRGFENRDGARRDGDRFARGGDRPAWNRDREGGDRDSRRPFENRGGFENRNRPEGRSFERRGYEGRDNRGFDHNRGGDRPAYGDRYARDDRRGTGTGTGSRPRTDWDRGAQRHSSRDGESR